MFLAGQLTSTIQAGLNTRISYSYDAQFFQPYERYELVLEKSTLPCSNQEPGGYVTHSRSRRFMTDFRQAWENITYLKVEKFASLSELQQRHHKQADSPPPSYE